MREATSTLCSMRKTPVFSYKKKLTALFIFVCMSINGYMFNVEAISGVHISEKASVLIMTGITYNIVTKIFNECNKSLMQISNNIVDFADKNIYDFEDAKESGQESPTSNSSSSDAIVEEIRKNEGGSKDIVIVSGGLGIKEIFRNYGADKGVGEGLKGKILLIFLIFIVGITHRKELGEAAGRINIAGITERTKISA